MAKLMQGRTSFVIAHRLSTIRDADTILVMDHGRSSSRARTRSCSPRRGFYSDLYDSQFAEPLRPLPRVGEAAGDGRGSGPWPSRPRGRP